MTARNAAQSALKALLATPTGRVLLRDGAVKLATMLGVSKQTLNAAMQGTDPLSYRIARRLAKLVGVPMQERARFLAVHVRAMTNQYVYVGDLDDAALELVIETIERYRKRQDELAHKRRGQPS